MINYKVGIDTWGDIDTFVINLKKFSEKHVDTFHEFETFVLGNQEHELRQLLHSMRGVTGNLALVLLYETLEQVSETLKHQGIKPLKEKLDSVQKSFKSTLVAIDHLGQEVTIRKETSAVDLLPLSELVDMSQSVMMQLQGGELDENHLKILALQYKHRGIPQDQLDFLAQAIDDFDFETAYALLANILSAVEEGERDEPGQWQPQNTSR
ncbi:hypothetical protein [Litoribacillus peritrichatus]|uniref:hypothetical protein n=1 Tax=Litoribacillus peritrichatus TaxID=718191 RepID=UPI0031D78DCE